MEYRVIPFLYPVLLTTPPHILPSPCYIHSVIIPSLFPTLSDDPYPTQAAYRHYTLTLYTTTHQYYETYWYHYIFSNTNTPFFVLESGERGKLVNSTDVLFPRGYI